MSFVYNQVTSFNVWIIWVFIEMDHLCIILTDCAFQLLVFRSLCYGGSNHRELHEAICALSHWDEHLVAPRKFFLFLPPRQRCPCPILSCQIPPSGQVWMDIWAEDLHLRLNTVQYPMANVVCIWHLMQDVPVPSYHIHPLCEQDWNGHISASNQDRALMFGS